MTATGAHPVVTMSNGDATACARDGNRIACWLLAGIVAVAPLPYAGTDPGTVALLVGLLGMALACCRPVVRDRRDWILVALAALIVVLYAIVLHEQLSPQPWLGIAPDSVWRETSRLIDLQQGAPLSLVR